MHTDQQKMKSLPEWIDYIQTLHARSIDLSLERVRQVYQLLYPEGVSSTVITIAGTNGKGSTAEMLASIYSGAGYSVGKYTSPHLVRFNERYEINRQAVVDSKLLASFERIESVRGEIGLTFFEFGTLIAIDLFVQAELDIFIMEVGLGGRLDAVNILDADVAVVTNISKDHTAWLGEDVNDIALEKIGIARPKRPLVVASAEPPETLLPRAKEIGAHVWQRNQEFQVQEGGQTDTWHWFTENTNYRDLPLPFDQSGHQIDNAAGALMAIECLQQRHAVSATDLAVGLGAARLPGRCQIVQESPLVIVDVSHNQASLERLADFVESKIQQHSGTCYAVCGMLGDKDIHASLAHMFRLVDTWFLASIHNERGASAAQIDALLPSNASSQCFEKVEAAYDVAMAQLTINDCLVVFGSFHIVGDIIAHRGKAS